MLKVVLVSQNYMCVTYFLLTQITLNVLMFSSNFSYSENCLWIFRDMTHTSVFFNTLIPRTDEIAYYVWCLSVDFKAGRNILLCCSPEDMLLQTVTMLIGINFFIPMWTGLYKYHSKNLWSYVAPDFFSLTYKLSEDVVKFLDNFELPFISTYKSSNVNEYEKHVWSFPNHYKIWSWRPSAQYI